MTDPKTETAANTASPPPARKRRRMLLGLSGVTLAAGLGWSGWYLAEGQWHEATDNAYVGANIVQITSRQDGTVVSVEADDGDRVTPGARLVQLDPNDRQLALSAAEADLAATVRRVRGLYSGQQGQREAAAAAQADVAARSTAVTRAQGDVSRRRDLARTGAISAEELAHAQSALTDAQSALSAAQAHAASIDQQYQSGHALVDGTLLTSHPDVTAAIARLRAAWLNLARSRVTTPISGWVAKRTVQVGQRVTAGEPLLAVVPLDKVWVDANFKESQLNSLRIGQPVTLTADVYGSSVRYDGRVAALGAGTGAAFALLPAQNATGNWIKIVQRVPVRIRLVAPRQVAVHPLRVGMSMKVDVDTGNRQGPVLAQGVRQTSMQSTNAYADEMAGADRRIAEILAANGARSGQ